MIGDNWVVTVQGKFANQDDIVNVFHYQETIGDATDATEIAEGWETSVLPNYLALLQNQYAVDMLRVRKLDDPSIGVDYDLSGSGARTGEACPPQTTALIKWRTAKFGKSYRGRSYLSPISETDQNGGGITTTLETALEAFAGVAQGFTAGASFLTLQVYSRTLNEVTPVTTFLVDGFMKTQRRRSRGVGS